MARNEAGFTTRLKKWMHAEHTRRQIPFAAAYEVKVTDSTSVPFSAVKQHQIDALVAVKHGVFTYKIPDAGWQNPFDMFLLTRQPAYVVLGFTASKPHHVWFIDIDTFLSMRSELTAEGTMSLNEKTLDRYMSDNNDNIVRYLI